MDEVVIAGAGPAGSSLACLLARQGVRVRLLDAARFPRPKPCGEALNPGAVAALARFGLTPPPAAAPLHGWRLCATTGEVTLRWTPPLHGLGCGRAALDAALLAQAARAGASVEQGVRVTDLCHEGRCVTGLCGITGTGRPFTLPAGLVVGADGLRSVVARRLGLTRRGYLQKLALTTHVRAAAADGLGEIHLGRGAVAGLAPLGGGVANLTLVLPLGAAALIQGDKAGFLRRALHGFPALAARLAQPPGGNAVLAAGPFHRPVRRCAVPGALLVGDAAGYYDPLTGQGIYRALRSAELAAPAVVAALAGGGWRPLRHYERYRRREFAAGLWLQVLIEAAVSRPRLLGAGLRALRRHPALARWLAARTGDCPRGETECTP